MIHTSATHPLRVDFVEQTVPRCPGGVGMTLAPGKRGASTFGGQWNRDLDMDLARLRQVYGATLIVSLMPKAERHALGVRGYARATRRHGLRLIEFPIVDGGVPEAARMKALLETLDRAIDRGERIVVHCRGGLGRTGTIVACLLIRRGASPDDAMRIVRAARPGTIENSAQERFVRVFGARRIELARFIRGLRAGPSQCVGTLQVTPLCLAAASPDPGYALAPTAIASGVLEVVERESAVVSSLEARNRGDVPALVLEGDTLLGCRQNRVVTHSVLLAPQSTVGIPVACMERGRWSSTSSRFQSGEMRMETAVRCGTAREKAHRGGGVDQRRLWAQVGERLSGARLSSRTADYAQFIQAGGSHARMRAAALASAPEQVGALVLHGSRLVALEVTAHPRIWRELEPRALASHLVAAGELPEPAGMARPEEWLDRVADARVDVAPGLGLGSDLVVTSDQLVGAGLSHQGDVAHLSVFGLGR